MSIRRRRATKAKEGGGQQAGGVATFTGSAKGLQTELGNRLLLCCPLASAISVWLFLGWWLRFFTAHEPRRVLLTGTRCLCVGFCGLQLCRHLLLLPLASVDFARMLSEFAHAALGLLLASKSPQKPYKDCGRLTHFPSVSLRAGGKTTIETKERDRESRASLARERVSNKSVLERSESNLSRHAIDL